RGGEGTNPTIGNVGVFEEVPEVRFETIVPQAKLAAVVHAFVEAHPYEEPAYEVYPLLLPLATSIETPDQFEERMVIRDSNAGTPTQLWFDGGSRGNPGPAASGFILLDANGDVVLRQGDSLGTVTNNVAEYNGLVRGLAAAVELGATSLDIYSDSELVVKQL